MLEYGEAYMEANARIIDAMEARMSQGAIDLAYRMASQANEAAELEAQADEAIEELVDA